ncbi:hypothetical protein EXIGLDRAFT_837636 [Exidia glandulosa HHB12029]|uniref:DUF6534 domain-containing protein n=1 Tax=Exidia glandulosa HHB12029 TaxID=1314781 RepID=A0A165GLH4_EXIGL|nr:hypothetical protein EXIGLDRAFT_837636 [Exidia glandulosa HHB12029]
MAPYVPLPDMTPLPEQVYLATVVQDLLAGCFIGTLLAMTLYGISLQQMHHYFRTYKQDPAWTKLTVLSVLLIETAMVILDIYFLYMSLISQFGFVKTVISGGGVFAANRALTGATATIVQIFFAWRVYVLSRQYIVPAVIVLLSFVGFGGCLALTVVLAHSRYDAYDMFEREAYIWAVSTVAADVVITTAMVWTLSRRKTGYQGSDDQVDKIIKLTLQTGALCTTWAIIDLALFAAMGRRNSGHLAFQVTIPKLYALSLMATLNSRKSPSAAAVIPRSSLTHRDAPIASVALNNARNRSLVTESADSTSIRDQDMEEISLDAVNPFAGEKRGRDSFQQPLTLRKA